LKGSLDVEKVLGMLEEGSWGREKIPQDVEKVPRTLEEGSWGREKIPREVEKDPLGLEKGLQEVEKVPRGVGKVPLVDCGMASVAELFLPLCGRLWNYRENCAR